MAALEAEEFEVVLGEDDGLEDLRSKYGHYAHENELQFIQGQCNAVVLIASSPGSLCELGLFSYNSSFGVQNSKNPVKSSTHSYSKRKVTASS